MPDIPGAKLALFLGPDLVVILRDNDPHIPYPDHWDLPGGGREPGESPEACILRETREELGLTLSECDLIWSRRYGANWFFAAHCPSALILKIRLGDEGQGWRMMPAQAYLAQPKAIPTLQNRLRDYLDESDRHLPMR